LKKWGFNLVRLGVMWESVEISPGVYNHTYLDQIEKLINALGN
jgi:aryl-phospho-beta-D-glucosidase BglC (GH1 family)